MKPRRQLQILGFSLIAAMFLAAACAGAPAPTPTAVPTKPAAPPTTAPTKAPAAPTTAPSATKAAAAPAASAGPVKAAWQAEWDKVVAASKQEGSVSIANTGGRTVAVALMNGFKQAYGITVEVISGKGAELTNRIQTERRAGLSNYDVYMGGSSTPMNTLKPAGVFLPMEPALILPDVTAPAVIQKTGFNGKMPWIDNDHPIMAGLAYPTPPLAVNTNMVKADEIKSYKDLLDPKWKGKMVMNDPTTEGAGNVFVLVTYNVMGRDFLAGLAKQDPQILRDQRIQLDWLAHGKIPVLIAPKPDVYFEFKSMGTPIMVVTPVEGGWLTCTPAATSLMNKSPHPNAAKLFLNWMLTKEGQTVLSQGTGGQSGRMDVPTDFLPQEGVRKQGVEYWPKDTEEYLNQGQEINKIAKEIFGPLVK